jgi:hypothetical protein
MTTCHDPLHLADLQLLTGDRALADYAQILDKEAILKG